ncbi:MAG: S1 RNA-binding domain-containing protein [Firmicutes bacterium]|nr:S1 RNA-binding domain-containing protein [Bacillota bacterium]
MNEFYPEGRLIETKDNKMSLSSAAYLEQARLTGKILEAKAIVCDNKHNLIVDLNCMLGLIPREESVIGIKEGTARDIAIISRVNKPVCFVVMKIEKQKDGKIMAILSRKIAQEICIEHKISKFSTGDVIEATVTHIENFGVFVDIGCGIISFLPIDTLSVSRIAHPSERFKIGMSIKAIIKSIIRDRINLTHKELLGTWEENAKQFHIGETVSGIARSIEEYGIFVELTPNLAGLAEIKEGVTRGQQISVYIKNIIPEKMKVKLVIIESFDTKPEPTTPNYFFDGNHMEKFVYSPASCPKLIETNFEQSLIRA